MIRLKILFSRRCCGGPVLVLSLALLLLGTLFGLLSAPALGWVFVGVGVATFVLCLMLGQSRCARLHGSVRLQPMP